MHSQDDPTIRTRALSQSAWLLLSLGLAVAMIARHAPTTGLSPEAPEPPILAPAPATPPGTHL